LPVATLQNNSEPADWLTTADKEQYG